MRAGNRAGAVMFFAQAAEAEERAFRLVETRRPPDGKNAPAALNFS